MGSGGAESGGIEDLVGMRLSGRGSVGGDWMGN